VALAFAGVTSDILSVADVQVLVTRLAPGSGFQFETLDPSIGATTGGPVVAGGVVYVS